MQFIKSNSSVNNALCVEAKGLELLRVTIQRAGIDELNVPLVYEVNAKQLSLQYLSAESPEKQQWQTLGCGLAKLHAVKNAYFGLSYDNFIGLSPQANSVAQNWPNFFIDNRLLQQVSWIKNQAFAREARQSIVSNRRALEDLLQCSEPSLVHGDLWSGNVMFAEGKVWLIDPAVYYGDPEVDIAMTEMFGGFAPEFYASYQEVRALSESYQTKKHVYNLYHYLNHYNLFGDSYLADCLRLLERVKAV